MKLWKKRGCAQRVDEIDALRATTFFPSHAAIG